VIASSFLRRMGMSRRSDLGGVALEAGALAAFATVLGAVVAVATAWPVVGHIDALPQYAPPTHVVVPWAVLAAGVGAAIVAGALLGIAAVAVAARANVGEALRVA
jgi:ABC-type antimicrobial peptide transport system permease subunit